MHTFEMIEVSLHFSLSNSLPFRLNSLTHFKMLLCVDIEPFTDLT